ncbi:MAG: ABC transporter permease [Acidimicrobiales bacterium]
MPEPSPRSSEDTSYRVATTPGQLPDKDFLQAQALPVEILEIADAHVAEHEELVALDPDQVSESDVVKRRLGIGFWLATAWVVLLVVAAILAPYIPGLRDPDKPVARPRQAPSTTYWFGTDGLGRDLFARVVYGARVTLLIALMAILFGFLLGCAIGLVAGYFKKFTETFLMYWMDVILAFPALLLSLAIVTFMGKSVANIILAIGIVAIPAIARLIRAATLQSSEREFVLAARATGAKNSRIIWREVLPNSVIPILSFTPLAIAAAIAAEGALGFLGVSVPPPTATWGGIINEARAAFPDYAYMVLIPSFVLFLTVFSFNYMGDRVREYYNIKEGGL